MAGFEVITEANYRKIAESDPTLALAGLRIEIEILAKNLATGFKLDEPKTAEPITSLLRRLREKGAITAEQADLARRILTLCNRAIHGQGMSREEALDVIDAASVIASDFLKWLSWGFDDNCSPTAGTIPAGH
jgi:hypothetical protein